MVGCAAQSANAATSAAVFSQQLAGPASSWSDVATSRSRPELRKAIETSVRSHLTFEKEMRWRAQVLGTAIGTAKGILDGNRVLLVQVASIPWGPKPCIYAEQDHSARDCRISRFKRLSFMWTTAESGQSMLALVDNEIG